MVIRIDTPYYDKKIVTVRSHLNVSDDIENEDVFVVLLTSGGGPADWLVAVEAVVGDIAVVGGELVVVSEPRYKGGGLVGDVEAEPAAEQKR